MFKHVQKYKDFLGNDQEDILRFNVSESEMMDLIKNDPSFEPNNLAKLVEEHDGLKMIDVIRKLIVLSYGELSDDGKKFRKNDSIALEFVQSAAYDALLDEFIEAKDETFVRAFMIGIFPAKFADKLSKDLDTKIASLPG